MTILLGALVLLAGMSLGLRTTSVLMPSGAHPVDRLALSIAAGALWTALVFEVSNSYRIFDFGLGLMLSLSPIGVYDLTKWWFRSRGRRSGWLSTGSSRAWLVVSRWLFLLALAMALLSLT